MQFPSIIVFGPESNWRISVVSLSKAIGMSLGPIAPREIIDFILADAPEPYPKAKVVALLTFCAWMRWPTDVELVKAAQIATAASVVLSEQMKGRPTETPLTIISLCEALIRWPLAGSYSDAFDGAADSVDIVGFFMHCPEDQKPSLLKARYFIDAGGFVGDDLSEMEAKQIRRSPSTLKVIWKEQAISSPFLWASHHFEEEMTDLIDLVPDEPESVDLALDFLRDKARFTRFLGVARFCQEKLLQLLDPAAAKFDFVTFPEQIQPVHPGHGTFDDQQLQILAKYRAPQ